MSFLQPALLYALPLMALPVIIHLLNKRRHRTMQWAAMMFLLKATRQSRGHKKLRHILILACRVLALATLLLAVSRPLAGSWLGWAFAGAPDTILLLLDRSSSMEATSGSNRVSKRERALNQLGDAAAQIGKTGFVLIDSASVTPQQLDDGARLDSIPLTAATDTEADIPGLLEKSLDYMVSNQSGKTEVWLASDLQKNDWQQDNARWKAVRQGFSELKQDTRIRFLALDDNPPGNISVTVEKSMRQRGGTGHEAILSLLLQREGTELASVPLGIVVEGARSVVDIQMTRQTLRTQQRIQLPESDKDSWGYVELPPDGNSRDNVAFFAFSRPQIARTLVVTSDGVMGDLLKVAAAPAPELLRQAATAVTPDKLNEVAWEETAMVVWQAPLPSGAGVELIDTFVRSGGQMVFFPSGQDVGADWRLFDTAFGALETAGEGEGAMGIGSWREEDGPLANTLDGKRLPLTGLVMRRRQPVLAQTGVSLASFRDGKPFLIRHDVGRGNVYFCPTLPHEEWSNLGDGLVLVPMLQRILLDGTQRLGNIRHLVCGENTPPELDTVAWERLDDASEAVPANQRYEAGIYRAGELILAVNRPEGETVNQVLDRDEVNQLFGSLPLTLFQQQGGGNDRNLASEVWRLFVYGMLFFLLGEALLCLPSAGVKLKPQPA